MKKVILGIVFLTFFWNVSLFAESVDQMWIVKEHTGSASSLQRVSEPLFSPGQTMYVYILVNNLGVKWGEGQVKWKYYYQSSDGKIIWASPFTPVSRRSSDPSWNFSEVVTISLPSTIPEGSYGLGFSLVDAHTLKEYRGWVEFRVGIVTTDQNLTAEPDQQQGKAAAPEVQQDFTSSVNGIRFTLVAVEKRPERLVITFTGNNGESEEQKLVLYPYSARIIDREGNEYQYADLGDGGSLAAGVSFPPGIPTMADIRFRRPTNTIMSMALLSFSFYHTDEMVELRGVPVPYP
ncbi:hypothetical protein [Sediminispirochaeta smaragdinae]|uniref:Uncharacterized protein n=1 Tax=Sediminispirochaeta smaragdinae (strain DSM 11293 / JCM 15392 / SEBR 4228) TaxID=573413 RepID=E1R8M9_SEDSS|nr:hypothetical protein [Sediminispirochaeta smaragdinae]ADK81786.1 hypothetical protein Spirs_2679 [Sediminispirochaeta smaragdinae DSM 11293]